MKKYLSFLSMIAIIIICACQNPQTKTPIGIDPIGEQKDSILEKARFGKELIEAYIPFQSPAVQSNGKTHLSYELQIANAYRMPMTLKKVELYNVENKSEPVATFDSIYIQENLQRPGLLTDKKYDVFEGSQYGILNIWWRIEKEKIPEIFFHKIYFEITTGSGETATLALEKALTNFPETTRIILQPPFRKGHWFYYTLGHKNTRELTEGKPSYAQRFAIDWVYLEEDGTFVNGDQTDNENYPTYGQELLAVADGVVVDIQNGIPDNQGESEERAIKVNRYNASGNHIVLDIGNNIHAVYAHLIPNSLRVKIGERVKAGDVLGLLGNSGESTGPHLHFHLETKNKLVLGGEGLPFHFNSFTQINSFDVDTNLDALFSGNKLSIKNSNDIRENEMPVGIGIIKLR